MFTVKTYLDKSEIHGFGVFASEFIRRGSLIWELSDLDILISEDRYKRLSNVSKSYIDNFAYKQRVVRVLCSDNAKYVNHSEIPNMEAGVALTDINIGDEITENYYLFDDLADDKLLNHPNTNERV